MKQKQKTFARRFSFDRWMILCNNSEFCAAFEAGEFELCEVLAANIP